MVLLRNHRLASVTTIFLLMLLLAGCTGTYAARVALTEANPLSSGIYHIEISGNNGFALLAYSSDIIDIDGCSQWDGVATIGAYGMAFQQECHSLYSETIQVKQWRGKWAVSTATSPRLQLQQWLQECRSKGQYDPVVVSAQSVLPLAEDTRNVVSLQLAETRINWDALCDAHIDTIFGSQSYLTDLETGTVTVYFDVDTLQLIGVVFTAQSGQTTIFGRITVSAPDKHVLRAFPEPNTITEGTLSEEWSLTNQP